MAKHPIFRFFFKLFTGYKALSIGTKYFPTTPLETEYVELFNYTQTVLMEIEEAHVTTESIFTNLVRDVGSENIPEAHSFYEITPAEDNVEEYALVSNIIMGSDRYLYVELSQPSLVIREFSNIILANRGEIVEESNTEIICKLQSKNDAIRVAIRLISLGLDNNVSVRSAVGMTGAASIERSIKFSKEVGDVSGVAFTKLGGEYAMVMNSPFKVGHSKSVDYNYYLFIDMVDSTKFISEHGRDKLVDLMTGITSYMVEDCSAHIEGYRKGGDDLIAQFPSKDLAIRAGLDSAWYLLSNGAKVKIGIGTSRREAGERANIAEQIKTKTGSSLSLVVFDLANGLYAYNIPSDFTRTVMDLFFNHKAKLIGLFIGVFIVCYFLVLFGLAYLGIFVVLFVMLYAYFS